MARLVVGFLSCALLALAVWTTVATRGLAELAGRHEVAARSAAAAAANLQQQVAMLQTERVQASERVRMLEAATTDPVAYASLRLELETTQQRLRGVEALLAQRNEELRARAAAALAANERAVKPIPAGVREAIEVLHTCLRQEGFDAQRFLSASRLDDFTLGDVELLEREPDGMRTAFVAARAMTAKVDRARGVLTLSFTEGARTVDGVRTPLPADGWSLVFPEIDGRLFEARLPYLVRGEGVYPAPVEGRAGRATDVDAFTRRQWQRRLDDLLTNAGTPERWRVTGFRGMQDGWFLDADLVGSDAKNHVVAGLHGERVAVEVDAATGVVSLRVLEGALLREGAESSIRGEGYRMLLPNLTPAAASRAMQGMVVAK